MGTAGFSRGPKLYYKRNGKESNLAPKYKGIRFDTLASMAVLSAKPLRDKEAR